MAWTMPPTSAGVPAATYAMSGEEFYALHQRAAELEAEIARLREALVEREARIIWERDQRKPWRYARDDDRDEFREYARMQLHKDGLLPQD